MTRVKRGTIKNKTRKNLLKLVKGYRWGRSKKEAQARTAYYHAHQHAFRHRRTKKRDFRRLFTVRINAAARLHGTTYSRLINDLAKAEVGLNRKMLSELANQRPDAFKNVVEHVSK